MRRLIIAALIFLLPLATAAGAQQTSQAAQEKPIQENPVQGRPPQSAEPKAAEPKAAESKANAQPTQRPAPAPGASSRSRSITGRVIDENSQPLEDATIVSL